MPQPDQVEALSATLRRFYEQEWTRISTDEQRLVDAWYALNRAQRLARLRELRATVEALMGQADEQALRFSRDQLPEAYLYGAAAAGTGAVVFAQPDLDAISTLAADTYDALLAATRFVRRSTKDLIRTLARQHVADKLIRGQTAQQAARDLARELEGQGITAVVYRDGSRHGLADYADVVVRTKSAEAYSTSTLNQVGHAGIGWVEVFDGIGCGFTSHDDPDKANGTIRTLEQARAFPLSHPRCRRAWGGRPDVTSARDARRAQPTTTEGQRADQAAAEQRQAEAVAAAGRFRLFGRAGGLLSDTASRTRASAAAAGVTRRARLRERRRQPR